MAGNANSGGRNAKSRDLHVVSGTFREDRHGAHETPAAPAGVPVPPRPLKGVAKAEWTRMVDRLTHTGAISKVDDAALYQYVLLFAETEEIMTEVAEARALSRALKSAVGKLNGHDLVTAIGRIVDLQQSLVKSKTQLRQGHMAIRQYLVEFGMTPSARTRVKLPSGSKQQKSRVEMFLAAKAHA